jgi:S-adenosyl-L-methionine hydrolase (adenosine-forming)
MNSEGTTSRILTLTTDWNQHDYYGGVLKGRLVTVCQDLKVVEITNQIPSFNLNHAAFVIRHSYKHFPTGTIHLVLVNSENSQSQRMLAFNHNEHFFVVPDNGLIGLIFKEPPQDVFEFPFESNESFSSLNASIKAIDCIYKGGKIEDVAQSVNNFDQRIPLRATIENSAITGSIIYIDSYMNAITNVSKDLFERVGQGRKFDLFVQSQHNRVDRISKTYNEVDPGELVALFNSAGLLEIAINNGHATELLSLSNNSSIRIKFYD